MSKRDYYEVLEVPRDADARAVKKAYRAKAVQFHPDRNPDDPVAADQFKEAAEAYEVLSNDEKHSVYDRFGHEGLAGSGYRGVADIGDIFGGLGDIFSEFFGGGRPRARRDGRAREAAPRCRRHVPLAGGPTRHALNLLPPPAAPRA